MGRHRIILSEIFLNLRVPKGNCDFQPSEVRLAMRAALRVQCEISTIPLAARLREVM